MTYSGRCAVGLYNDVFAFDSLLLMGTYSARELK